jgi:hypothetical protein
VEWLKAPVPQKKKKKIKWPRKLDKTVLQLKRTLIRFFVFVLLVVWFDGDSLSQWPLNSWSPAPASTVLVFQACAVPKLQWLIRLMKCYIEPETGTTFSDFVKSFLNLLTWFFQDFTQWYLKQMLTYSLFNNSFKMSL